MKNVHTAAADPAKKLNFPCLIAAAVFLFNPCLNILDLLPDFFGILLLMKGLSKWADLCPGVADALQGLAKLRWFLLLKAFAMLLVPLVDDTYVLIFTFAFTLIEFIYLLPALERIFDGFEYFGMRYNSRAVYMNLKNLRMLTNLFFIGKGVLVVLPELCSLSSFEYDGYVTSGVQINFASYKSVLILGGALLSTLMGIVWLVNILGWLMRIGREKPFLQRVSDAYENEIAQNSGLLIRRNLRTVFTLILVGFVFFLNLWMDGMNVIPTVIGAVLLLLALLSLNRRSPVCKAALILLGIFVLISGVSFGISTWFSGIYGLSAIEYDYFAYELYTITQILYVAEYILMTAAVFFLYGELRRLIGEHLAPAEGIRDRRLTDFYSKQQQEALRGVSVGFIGFLLSAITNLAYILTRVSARNYFIGQGLFIGEGIVPDLWLIPFVITLIWLLYTISNLNQLFEQIEYKYM